MTGDPGPFVPARLVLGIVTFILGALFLADSAGLLRADSALAFWPLAIVALGIVVVLQPDTANRMVGAVLLTAGVWLLLNAVGVWSYSFWRVWPYLLVAFGAWMLWRLRQMRERERLDDTVVGFAFLNQVARQAARVPLRGGEFSAVGGGCHVDLRAALIADVNRVVVIDAFALFGRIEVVVPAGWQVDNRVLPLLGRVDAMPATAPARTPAVVICGSAICGSVSVGSGD